MRTIKLILGIGCFVAALLPGGYALLFVYAWVGEKTVQTFWCASLLAIMAICLVRAGWFLITRRDSPMSWKPKVLIGLLFFGFSLFVAAIVAIIIISTGRSESPANRCLNNLRQIDCAANEFGLEKNLKTGDKINFPDDLTPYIKLTKDGKIPPCPQGGIYSIKKVGDIPTCSLGTTVTSAHVLP
jgi:hypothetical protein